MIKQLSVRFNRRFMIIPVLAIVFSCHRNSIPEEGSVNARIIEYKVSYLQDMAGNIPTSMLPNKMTVTFADHFALTRIDGLLGQFSLSYLANLKNNRVITMVKFFDIKLVHYGKPGEPPISIEPIQSMKISEQEDYTDIAGFNCKKLLICSSNQDTFNVYFTDQIKVKNPNATTSYKDIDGVLLKFNTKLDILHMQLSAERYNEKEVPRTTFMVPENYKKASRKDIEKVIEHLLN